jgi:hypothetical protein
MTSDELRGIKLPNPHFRIGPLSDELFRVEGYRNLQTYFPTLNKVFRLGRWNTGDEIWMDTRWRIRGIDCSGTSGPCKVSLSEHTDPSRIVSKRPAFLKVTHLLDPIGWMQGQYSLPKESGLPWFHKAWLRAWQKLQDPRNQAYVEAVAAYAVGRIREGDLSPHFNEFYGAFCARANKYRYNLSEEFQSYRHERWFWKGREKGLFSLQMLNSENEPEEITEDLLKEFMEAADSEEEDSSSEDLEELSVLSGSGSLNSADSMNDVPFAKKSTVSTSASTVSTTSTSSSDLEEDVRIYADIENYPVMLILSEQNSGTMDNLFENHAAAGAQPGTPEWETRWSAWLFQVVAALSCLQSILGFTHNDLHTNNIVWSETSDEFLYYTNRSGSLFRVPTFGKIFRIIDFGRAIFKINGQIFISDDFKVGNDAEGQYCFSPLVQKVKKEIPPNPSFDLCRLAVSLIDGVFPKIPGSSNNGNVLSNEPGLIVYETESHLYNMLWSWMIDDSGRNIFINPDGSERFPDFDLYKHIAAHIHKAVPAQQFNSVTFDRFQWTLADVPKGEKVYGLFC